MAAPAAQKPDYYEWVSRWLTLLALGFAAIATGVAPILAIWWSNQPFPGFMVEQTLVVTGSNGAVWVGSSAGMRYPQRVSRVDGFPVTSSAEFQQLISHHRIGEQASFFTIQPDRSARLYPSIVLTEFPVADMWRMFWLPFLIGTAYLGIGIWIYRVSGRMRPGRALAFFCACTAIACILLFDLSTTHAGSALWTVAIAGIGGALISLALRFPQEWGPVGRRPWLLGVPYGISIFLAVWGLAVLYDTSRPWAYVSAWGTSYEFATVGIVAFLGVMVYRAFAGNSTLVRQQARVVLLGSALAFMPMLVWFVAPLLGSPISFNTVLFLPGLLLFALSIAIAILRYRLLEADTIVNRTVVYGLVTAVLAGVFAVSITASQKLFIALTGEKSDAAIVITTLILVAAIEPIKKRVQGLVDRRFKEPAGNTRELRQFDQQVRSFAQMSDAAQITSRLLDEAARSLQASSGAVSLALNGRLQTTHTYGDWRGEAWISVPLVCEGRRFGLLFLGPRQNQGPYSKQEFGVLQQVAADVATAICLTTRADGALRLSDVGDNHRNGGNGASPWKLTTSPPSLEPAARVQLADQQPDRRPVE
jgi:hypothetical protein